MKKKTRTTEKHKFNSIMMISTCFCHSFLSWFWFWFWFQVTNILSLMTMIMMIQMKRKSLSSFSVIIMMIIVINVARKNLCEKHVHIFFHNNKKPAKLNWFDFRYDENKDEIRVVVVIIISRKESEQKQPKNGWKKYLNWSYAIKVKKMIQNHEPTKQNNRIK